MEPIKLVQRILTPSPHFFKAFSNIFCSEDDFISTRNVYYSFLIECDEKANTLSNCNDLIKSIFDWKNPFVDFEKISFKSLSLYDPLNLTTVSKWEDVSISTDVSNYYLLSGCKEIHNEIWETIEELNEGEKIELKIQVNQTMEEFVYIEFTKEQNNASYKRISRDGDDSFFSQFPDEIRLVDYEMRFIFSLSVCASLDKINVDVVENEGFIKNIKGTITNNQLPHIFKNEKYEFQEFDLSIFPNPSEESKSNSSSSFLFEFKKEVKTEEFRLETFFYSHSGEEKIQKISKIELKKATNSNIGFDNALPTYEFIESEEEVQYRLFKIEEKEKYIKLTLTRPKENDNTNSLKEEDSLTIKCISGSICRKPVEVTVNAKEKIKGDYIETTFIMKKPKEKTSGEYVLHHSLKNKLGLFEISINGEKGVIGTYGILMIPKGLYMAIYNNQLLSIPFPPCGSEAAFDETETHMIETQDISNKVTIIFLTILAAIVITRGIFMVVLRHYW